MQFYVVRHPGVKHTETRVSDCSRPGSHTSRHPGVRQVLFKGKQLPLVTKLFLLR